MSTAPEYGYTSSRTHGGNVDALIIYGPPGVGGTTAAIVADPSALVFGAPQHVLPAFKLAGNDRPRLATYSKLEAWAGRANWNFVDLKRALDTLEKMRGKDTGFTTIYCDDFSEMGANTMEFLEALALSTSDAGKPFRTNAGKPHTDAIFREVGNLARDIIKRSADVGVNLILRCHERQPGEGRNSQTGKATWYPGGPKLPSRNMGSSLQPYVSTQLRVTRNRDFTDPLSLPGRPYSSLMSCYPPDAAYATRDRWDILPGSAPLSLFAYMYEAGTLPVIAGREWMTEQMLKVCSTLTDRLGGGYTQDMIAATANEHLSAATASGLSRIQARLSWQAGWSLAVMRAQREAIIPTFDLPIPGETDSGANDY